MLRLLFFVEPKPLPANLFRNHYWVDFPIRLAKQLKLDGTGALECHIAVPKRFENIARTSGVFDDRLHIIDETKIFKILHKQSVSLRDHWVSEFLGSTAQELKQEVDREVCSDLPNGPWDIVITFGEECRYTFAEDSFKVNMESSPFSRTPFQHSFFMDHLGLFRNSAPSSFFADDAKEDNHLVPLSDLSERIRDAAWNQDRIPTSLKFQRKHDRYFLLPLQASNYPSFDAQTSYGTQIDFLMDCVGQFDKDIGLLVTEHPEVPSISRNYDIGSVLKGLEDLYSNVTFLPRAKHFPSASFDLLPEVEGVWTVASNIAPVASLFGTKVGVPSDSHLSFLSDAGSIDQLCRQDLARQKRIDAALQWMFQYYLLPSSFIEKKNWLLEYLLDRRLAFLDHRMTPASFLKNDFQVEDFVEEVKKEGTTRSIHFKTLLEHKIEKYQRDSKQWLQELESDRSGDRTYVLLNDTANLEAYRHIGCNHVQSVIFKNMSERGFSLAGKYNGKSDFPENMSPPEWIIINGEGSFHHQSYRAIEMMEFAREFQKKGTKIALVNSIWEANNSDMADLVRPFDLIAVRDSASFRQLKEEGIQPILTSDFSIGNWAPLEETYRQPRAGVFFSDNIVFDRAVSLFDASQRFNGTYWLLDHRQLDEFEKAGCLAESCNWSLSPDFLTQDWPIDMAKSIVTGRFHVAMGCIAFRNRFLYVESNTMKITNLCKDIGLPIEQLNVTEIVEKHDWKELEKRLEWLEKEFDPYLEKINLFVETSVNQINGVFDQIALQEKVATAE